MNKKQKIKLKGSTKTGLSCSEVNMGDHSWKRKQVVQKKLEGSQQGSHQLVMTFFFFVVNFVIH